jgi:GNAT superfamily N-acetyltransferase
MFVGSSVRRARPEDAAHVQALYQELVPGDSNITVRPERLKAVAADPNNHLLVLEVDGLVVGTAFLTLCLDSMYGFHPYGVVENIIVAASALRRGGGRALMAEVESIARAARCTKLMLTSGLHRTDAHVFFTAIGFDGTKKRGFVKYLNRTQPLTTLRQ